MGLHWLRKLVDDDGDEDEEVQWGEKESGSMADEEKGHTGAGRNEAEHILNACTEKTERIEQRKTRFAFPEGNSRACKAEK